MVVVSVPFAFSAATSGCVKAPELVLSGLQKNSFGSAGLPLQLPIEQVVGGNYDLSLVNELVYQKARQVFRGQSFPVFVGGDHAVTYSILKAFHEQFQDVGIVIFDAHPDCCVDFNPPTHEDLVLALVRERLVRPENILIVGVRSWHRGELSFLKENKIKYYPALELSSEGVEVVCDAVMGAAKDFGSLYVSIDMDVVDPAHAPGVSYPVPGGLSSRELLYFLHRLQKLRNLRAVDVMEINPEKDDNGMTVKLGAEVMREFGAGVKF